MILCRRAPWKCRQAPSDQVPTEKWSYSCVSEHLEAAEENQMIAKPKGPRAAVVSHWRPGGVDPAAVVDEGQSVAAVKVTWQW